MNNKGFTLVELMAVLVLLSIVVGITLGVFNFNFDGTKKKSEETFVGTIKDSLEVYLTSKEAKELNFDVECSSVLEKTHGNVKIYKANTTFKSVIVSEYSPITQDDLVNPGDKDNSCANVDDIEINIYKDEDFVYYYSVDKSEFGCLKNDSSVVTETLIDADGNEYNVYYSDIITNLPEGFSCE